MNNKIKKFLFCFLFFLFLINKSELSNIKNELSTFPIQKNEVHEKLYLLSLFDYDFLFRDLENKYNDSVNKNLSNHEKQINFIQDFFLSLVDKTLFKVRARLKTRQSIFHLVKLFKAVAEDEVYAITRLFEPLLFKEMIIFLDELFSNQSSLSLYENDDLDSYLKIRISGIFSLYCLKLTKIQNEEERRALISTIKTLFWIFYIAEDLEQLFHSHDQNLRDIALSDIEISCCFFILKTFQLNQTYQKIQFYDSIARYLPAKTFQGSNYLQRRMSLSFFSEDMAVDLINREVAVSKKALSSRHQETIEGIRKIYNEKIIPIIQELSLLEKSGEDSLIRYFHSFIPPKFLFKGSKQSSKLSFFTWSLFQRYMDPSFFTVIGNFFSSLHFYKKEKKYSFIHFPLVKTIGLPVLNLYPWQSKAFELEAKRIATDELAKYEKSSLFMNNEIKNKYRDYHGVSNKDFFDSLDKKTNQEIYEKNKALESYTQACLKDLLNDSEKLTLGDKIAYLQHGPLSDFFKNHRYLLLNKAFSEQLFLAIINGYSLVDTGRSFVKQYRQGVSNNSKYLLLQRKLILYTKQIFDMYQKLFLILGENSEPSPEFLLLQKSFLEMKKNKQHIFNQILSRNNNYFSSIYNGFLGFLAPGLLSHFYFNHLEDNKEIAAIYLFLGYIEFFLNKIDLLKKSEDTDYCFSLPQLIQKNESACLDIKDMWYSAGMKNPTKNSILLDEQGRNILLVSPVAGGKTVFLSTLLTVLHMANLGIVSAESVRYTYFSKIVDHLTHEYIVGGGLSQHLAERKSMEFIETIVEKNYEENLIVFIDEIFRGTRPDLAIKEAFLVLPNILKRKNIITIVTTHFPEMIELTKKENLSLNLYYLIVDFISGQFYRRFLLVKDDEKNWWVRDPSLAMLYQQSIKV